MAGSAAVIVGALSFDPKMPEEQFPTEIPDNVLRHAIAAEVAITEILERFHQKTGWFINTVLIPEFVSGNDRVEAIVWPSRQMPSTAQPPEPPKIILADNLTNVDQLSFARL